MSSISAVFLLAVAATFGSVVAGGIVPFVGDWGHKVEWQQPLPQVTTNTPLSVSYNLTFPDYALKPKTHWYDFLQAYPDPYSITLSVVDASSKNLVRHVFFMRSFTCRNGVLPSDLFPLHFALPSVTAKACSANKCAFKLEVIGFKSLNGQGITSYSPAFDVAVGDAADASFGDQVFTKDGDNNADLQVNLIQTFTDSLDGTPGYVDRWFEQVWNGKYVYQFEIGGPHNYTAAYKWNCYEVPQTKCT